jgi:shikimate kinase
MKITLIGMPGTGKSHVGAILAARLGFPFVDTDRVMEMTFGAPLPELLASFGAERFLEEEATAVLAAIDKEGDAVLAPGGSVVLCEDAMRRLSERSVVVHLHAELPTIIARIGDVPRGIVGDKPIEQIFSERAPLYERWAELTVNAESPAAHVVNRLIAALGENTGA